VHLSAVFACSNGKTGIQFAENLEAATRLEAAAAAVAARTGARAAETA
jgi:hypothetical protein